MNLWGSRGHRAAAAPVNFGLSRGAAQGSLVTAERRIGRRGVIRHCALRRMFAALPALPRSAPKRHRSQFSAIFPATADAPTLMSTLEVRLKGAESLRVLPFRSRERRRADGIARRADWQPRRIHRHLLDVLRRQAEVQATGLQIEASAARLNRDQADRPAARAAGLGALS